MEADVLDAMGILPASQAPLSGPGTLGWQVSPQPIGSCCLGGNLLLRVRAGHRPGF